LLIGTLRNISILLRFLRNLDGDMLA